MPKGIYKHTSEQQKHNGFKKGHPFYGDKEILTNWVKENGVANKGEHYKLKPGYAVGSRFKKGYEPWNKGITGWITRDNEGSKNPFFGKKHTEETKEKMRKARLGKIPANIDQLKKRIYTKYPTSIERAVYDYLLMKGVIFEKQKEIDGKFIVDAYIPSLNLIIECDGVYWHSLPKAIIKDKIKNKYFKSEGFNLLRLTEKEINEGTFKERIKL